MAIKLTACRNDIVKSTSDYAYDILREAIITHQIPAGTRLVEAKTAKDLGVSITPVRQAFARLANQGLLTVFPYKGTYVTIMSKEYVEDVYALRKNLEIMAAERGIGNVTDEDIAYYKQLCIAADDAYANEDLYESIHCDLAFHEHMFTLSGSSLLSEMWNIIKYRIESIQSYTKPSMNARMIERHGAILEALRLRDYSAYVTALMNHLNTNLDNVQFPDEADIRYE